jgi:hypothetical protein
MFTASVRGAGGNACGDPLGYGRVGQSTLSAPVT